MSRGTPAAFNLVIPPGENNAEAVSDVTVGIDDAKLVYIQPHLHLRGKDYELRLIYLTGEIQTVFKGQWNFDWQIGYQLEKPILMPKRYARSCDRSFRQLPQQQVQSRSKEASPLGYQN